MKKTKRILGALTALMLIISLLPAAHAAGESGVTLSMTFSSQSIRVGENMSAVIRADRGFSSRGAGMTICYDDTALEPDLAGSSAAAPFRIDGPLSVNGKTALRVSFLPGADAAAFSAEDPLAVLSFRAKAVTDKATVAVSAAYLYDELLSEIPLSIPAEGSVTIEPPEVHTPVEGVTLGMTELTFQEGETAVLKATVTPAGASDPAVIWTSSDERVAVVSDGAVKARTEGTAVITAKTRDGGFTASCTVRVTPPYAGYTAMMPADTAAYIGETVKIPVVISNEDGKTGYNAFNITFDYDNEALELATEKLSGVTISEKNGKLSVLGYGGEKEAGSVPFVLEFRVRKMGTTEVRISSARVDNSGNALVRNASLAALIDDCTVIGVSGYPVSLPDGFEGEAAARPDTDYTFAEPDDYFDYKVTAKAGGKDVLLKDNGDGTYTVPAEYVNGAITVTAAKSGKKFRVTLGTDMTGDPAAYHGTDYIAAIDRDEAYRYNVTVTMGGEEYFGYAASGKTYTIPGGDIIGDIVFTVGKELITPPEEPITMHSVTFTGSAAGAAQGNAVSAAHGSAYTFRLKKQSGYSYQVSYIMGGKPKGTVTPDAKGNYVIGNVTAPLEIRIEKTLNIRISVQEFVTLDEKSAFLILAEAALSDGNVFTYDGHAMYYSEAYGAWAYLVITDQIMELEKVQPLVKIAAQKNLILESFGCDADGNGRVDADDMQRIRDLYNAEYDNFGIISMAKFLNADINADRKLDIRDAACVTWAMQEDKEVRA